MNMVKGRRDRAGESTNDSNPGPAFFSLAVVSTLTSGEAYSLSTSIMDSYRTTVTSMWYLNMVRHVTSPVDKITSLNLRAYDTNRP
jgi:hypothetical protein